MRHRASWAGLAVLALPTFLIGLDLTVLHLAVPAVVDDLRPSPTGQLWIIDAYGFAVAGLLLTMGNVGDRIGRRRLLLLGAAGFATASVLAAFAPAAGWLIAARAVLGVAGATLMPSTLSLIRDLFTDDRRRTTAIAVWMAALLTGTALGPLVGGVVLELFWWGAVFLLGVPVMIALLIVGPFVLPAGERRRDVPLDGLSVALSLLAVLPVVYAIKETAAHGPSIGMAALVVAGALAGWAFVGRQRRLDQPLLDVGLFSDARFGTATATHLVSLAVLYGVQYLFSLYLQLGLGMDPFAAGLWMLPGAVLGLLGAGVAPALARRAGPAAVIGGGVAVAAAGMLLLVWASTQDPFLAVAGFATASLAVGAVTTLTTDRIVAAAPADRAGMASGISETAAELGIALGMAVLGSVATAVQAGGSSVTAGLQTSAVVGAATLAVTAVVVACNLGTRRARACAA